MCFKSFLFLYQQAPTYHEIVTDFFFGVASSGVVGHLITHVHALKCITSCPVTSQCFILHSTSTSEPSFPDPFHPIWNGVECYNGWRRHSRWQLLLMAYLRYSSDVPFYTCFMWVAICLILINLLQTSTLRGAFSPLFFIAYAEICSRSC